MSFNTEENREEERLAAGPLKEWTSPVGVAADVRPPALDWLPHASTHTKLQRGNKLPS